MVNDRTLTPQEARAFYDGFGSKQDWQRFYEAAAVRDLVQHSSFENATAVVEFGCGTGYLAQQLLTRRLGDAATYLAADISSTMVSLTRKRLARFGGRVRVVQTDGTPYLKEPAESCDRFLSTYVVDLLPVEDIHAVIGEAHRLLQSGGRLGLVSLTHGATAPARLVERLWVSLHRIRPAWVGGCRPVALLEFFGTEWRVIHHAVLTSFAISSEVVVAEKVFRADT